LDADWGSNSAPIHSRLQRPGRRLGKGSVRRTRRVRRNPLGKLFNAGLGMAMAPRRGLRRRALFDSSNKLVGHQFEPQHENWEFRPTAEIGESIIQLRLRIAVIQAWKNYRNGFVTYAKYGRRAN
jgi:hypothetical protein